MIKKPIISLLLLCSSNVLMAEDVTPAEVEAIDTATKMESMQIRATAAEQPAVPANVPSTTESVTAKKLLKLSIRYRQLVHCFICLVFMCANGLLAT